MFSLLILFSSSQSQHEVEFFSKSDHVISYFSFVLETTKSTLSSKFYLNTPAPHGVSPSDTVLVLFGVGDTTLCSMYTSFTDNCQLKPITRGCWRIKNETQSRTHSSRSKI